MEPNADHGTTVVLFLGAYYGLGVLSIPVFCLIDKIRGVPSVDEPCTVGQFVGIAMVAAIVWPLVFGIYILEWISSILKRRKVARLERLFNVDKYRNDNILGG